MTAVVSPLLHHDESGANGNDAISIAIRKKKRRSWLFCVGLLTNELCLPCMCSITRFGPCYLKLSLKNNMLYATLNKWRNFTSLKQLNTRPILQLLATEIESRVEGVFTFLLSVTLPLDSSSATLHHYFFSVAWRMTDRNSHTLFDTHHLKGFTDFLPNLPTSVIIQILVRGGSSANLVALKTAEASPGLPSWQLLLLSAAISLAD